MIVTPTVGMSVKLDGASYSRQLLRGDDFCPFRLESHARLLVRGEWTGPACRVEITGRLINRKDKTVRCVVVFLGDGEPDQRYPGVMYVPSFAWGQCNKVELACSDRLDYQEVIQRGSDWHAPTMS